MDAKVILCDFAEVSGGKLFITGAGVSLMGTPATEPPHRLNVCLALLVSITAAETEKVHRMTVELVAEHPDGPKRVPLTDQASDESNPNERGLIVVQFGAPPSPLLQSGDELTMPMSIPLFGLPLPDLGSYYFTVSINGREMDRAWFRLMQAVQATPQELQEQVQASANQGQQLPDMPQS